MHNGNNSVHNPFAFYPWSQDCIRLPEYHHMGSGCSWSIVVAVMPDTVEKTMGFGARNPGSNKLRVINNWEKIGKCIALDLPTETLTMTDISMKKSSTPTRVAVHVASEQSDKMTTQKKRQQGSASIAFGKARSNEETLGEAHALAVLYGDKEAASIIHSAIAACDPESGYKILLYRCTYKAHYSDSLKKRRWKSNRAQGLPERFHEIAKKAIKQKDSIVSLHKAIIKDYQMLNESQRLAAAQQFRDKVRNGID